MDDDITTNVVITPQITTAATTVVSTSQQQQQQQQVTDKNRQMSSPPRSMIIIPSSIRSTTPITSNLNNHRTTTASTTASTTAGAAAVSSSPSTTTTSSVMNSTSNVVLQSHPQNTHHPSLAMSNNSNVMPTTTTNKRLYRTAVTTVTTKSASSNASATMNSTDAASTTAVSSTTNHATTSSGNGAGTTGTGTTTTITKWVTRDIASLEFLLNIPLAAEREIVTTGYQLQTQRELDYYHSHHPSSASSSSSGQGESQNGNLDPGRTKKVSFHEHTSKVSITSSAKGTWWEQWIATSTDPALPRHIKNKETGLVTTKKNEVDELEQPTEADRTMMSSSIHIKSIKTSIPASNTTTTTNTSTTGTTIKAIPGRRLDGDIAIRIQIPVTTKTKTTTSSNRSTSTILLTKQTSIARQAALREWEIQTAYGSRNGLTTPITPPTAAEPMTGSHSQQPTTQPVVPTNMGQPSMLDGRLFFSANSSYPISVFSVIRYEPRKEEAAFRRRKLEAIGGGGSQFVLPNRDWRGISYRALLRRSGDDKKETKKFNRFVRSDTTDLKEKKDDNVGSSNKTKNGNNDDSSTTSDSSSSSDDSYAPGLLDDPEMVLGRHRNVMIGDRVTGPIVSSTIQFVKPVVLKAELNKQFRERFDGWEPPKSARKYIGAKVIQGNYVLIDPTEELFDDQSYERRRPRQNSVNSTSTSSEGGPKEYTIRMPPSLTLSKIRSVKRQALNAAVKANLEIGTVALACVYFERLCLDCRVDKSNRRVTFAACLLLAAKLNEPNVGLVMEREKKHGSTNKTSSSNEEKQTRFQSMIRPNERSNNMFASLLLFFTQDWNLSLKYLFTVEWGVFAALNFSLDASPSQIAFHFKRLMKTLEWNVLNYLGSTMYSQWQDALADEEERRNKRERRREASRKSNEDRIRSFRFQFRNEQNRDTASADTDSDNDNHKETSNKTENNEKNNLKFPFVDSPKDIPPKSPARPKSITLTTASTDHTNRRIKLFNRFNLGRSASTEHLESTTTTTITAAAAAAAAISDVRTTTIVPLTEKEVILPLHTSPSMPNFMRSTSSLVHRDDDVQKSNKDKDDYVTIDIPDIIETDETMRTATPVVGSIYDDIEEGRLRPLKDGSNDKCSSSNDDDGIIL